MTEPLAQLVDELRRAALEISGHGPQNIPYVIMDCLQFADRINALANRLESGDVTAVDELFGLFAPTTVWDDAGGSAETGNRVFELLRPWLDL